MSIALNIAEGGGRSFPKEKKNFYSIAKGSVFECVPLIEIGLRAGLLTESEKRQYRETCVSLARMLTNLIKSIETQL